MVVPLRPPVDHASLARDLAALGYATRLELLDLLRLPKALSEIRLAPGRLLPGENPDRPMARQALERHLERLVAAGIVRRLEGAALRFEVNPARLYAMVESLRGLVVRYGGAGGAHDLTATIADAPAAKPPDVGHLVLVHGLYEGKTYPLAPDAQGAGSWTIGRERGLPVCLDYDSFVSHEHARIEAHDGNYLLCDGAASKNGTYLNWQRLAKDEPRLLQAGDVIALGQSRLLFRQPGLVRPRRGTP